MSGYSVRTGIRAPSRIFNDRMCAGSCGVVIDMSELPWFQGPVFCSSRCQQRTPRAPVSAVKEARTDGNP